VPANRALVALAAWALSSLSAFAACEIMDVREQRYAACRYAPGEGTIEIRNLDSKGEPFRYLEAFATELAGDGKTLVMGMNAGMFDENQRPIGYYVEEGKLVKKLNRRNGGGNFHLKPNGIFFVKNGKAQVMETEAFAKSGIKPDFASQSGPMLVISGKIHPKFSETGTSRKIRNGVGVDGKGNVSFVMSEGGVTFWEFAAFFRDELKSSNALFFDGTVSSLYAPELGRSGGFFPVGPMVGVLEMR
jgi:uncharacterized protein YigE (DUF2233 family)